MIRIVPSSDRTAIARWLASRQASLANAEAVAGKILGDVRKRGDRALLDYSKKFDGVDLRAEGFTVKAWEIREAFAKVPKGFVAAVRTAARNIRAVSRRQLPRTWQTETVRGVKVSQILRPLERVACYCPGGRFPLPSTVLMSVVPAQVAGVREIFVTSPRPAPAVLVAADILGVRRIYRLGGAQAIAAFAYGTESVPRVDKIVGPGNRYVAAAKKIVAGECGIDFVAGPTELVVAGARGRAEWIAAEMVAQAEHDPDAIAVLITPSLRLARAVQKAVEAALAHLPPGVARKSLVEHGRIIVTRNAGEAIELVNRIAPEHLTLLEDAEAWLDKIQSAGSIFLGDWSPVAAGDYASGTNHILPTAGAARLRGGLSAADFVKLMTVQKLNRAGLKRLRSAITTLANTEGLKAHAYSVETRFSDASTA
ncbi:MAG: histidinol dehydrogenase [Deltaproteobacteria bacterium]